MTPEEAKKIQDQRSRDIAYRIVAELVCCDVYERVQRGEQSSASIGDHDICFWGNAAALIAIEDLNETLEEVLAAFNRGVTPWPIAPYQREEEARKNA